jgi:predicted nucleic acid-binding protein
VTTLLDTGPLVANAHVGDNLHEACAKLLEELPAPLLLPTTVLIESCWLIKARVGAQAQATFLDAVVTDLADERYELVELTDRDVQRMAEVARTYIDLRIDPTDASVIALAERFDVRQVATLDHRDFEVVRPRHCTALTLLP